MQRQLEWRFNGEKRKKQVPELKTQFGPWDSEPSSFRNFYQSFQPQPFKLKEKIKVQKQQPASSLQRCKSLNNKSLLKLTIQRRLETICNQKRKQRQSFQMGICVPKQRYSIKLPRLKREKLKGKRQQVTEKREDLVNWFKRGKSWKRFSPLSFESCLNEQRIIKIKTLEQFDPKLISLIKK